MRKSETMIKCVIIDDEPRSISVLKKMIRQYCPDLNVAATASDIKEGAGIIREVRPQLVFLDVEMPPGDAFEMLGELMPLSFDVILVTAHDTYAIKGFKYGVLDYLLKPVEIDELKMAVERAGKRIAERDLNHHLNMVIPHLRGDRSPGKIALREKDGLTLFAVNDIAYCSAEGGYTRFCFSNANPLVVSGNLKEFEEQLPKDIFCRIHDSYLVNLNYVKKYYNGKGGYIEMMDGKTIEVSVRKKPEFLARLKH